MLHDGSPNVGGVRAREAACQNALVIDSVKLATELLAPKGTFVTKGSLCRYEDGDTTLRKVCSAADFIWSDSPREILGSVTSITFEDPACMPIKDHTLTTEEIKALCDDPRAYGNQDSNHLLKKALSPSEKATSTTTPAEIDGKEDEDEKVLNEMVELKNATEQKKKRAKKLLAKRQAKDKARKALGKQIDATEHGYTDQELFSLTSIKGKKDLAAVYNNEYNDENEEIGSSDSKGGNEEAQGDASNDADTDDQRQR
ncbi:FtsJ-like methyltransferase family protein [Abeliophyllum distichum]|uniref:FtsJ-like methyltransferase family protein n=1 Tax=Abeliophyllum distichum TaxID=126358 RepID=A0ABD1TIF5_9LAMI